jgi:hypothetical protein
MSLFRQGTNPVWGIFIAISVIAFIGLDFYWLFTRSGPVPWLAKQQASLLNSFWSLKLTFLIIFLVQIGLLLGLKWVVEKIIGKKMTEPYN